MADIKLTAEEARLALKHMPIAHTEDGRDEKVIALKKKLAKAVDKIEK